jgi:phytoene dehydrogenase-like protein
MKEQALVIGSGIGGLSTGILLQRLGYAVTVIEKNTKPGGLMRSYLRQGIDCPVGVHYLGALGQGQLLRDLFDLLGISDQVPLERMGQGGVIDRYLFDDFVFDLPEGLAQFEANLHAAFPDQGGPIKSLLGELQIATEHMCLSKLLSRDTSNLPKRQCMGDWLDQIHCSQKLRQLLDIGSSWIGVYLDECPLSLFVMTLASYLCSSWKLKCSGQEMADVVADRLRALGGHILTGDPVVSIRNEARHVSGLELASGKVLKAPLVISSIHPKATLTLLAKDAVRPSYRNRIQNLRETSSCLAVQVAVPADDFDLWEYNLIRYKVVDQKPFVIFCQTSTTKRKDTHLLSLVCPAEYGDWQGWLDTGSGSSKRRPGYREYKTQKASSLLQELKPHLGPIEKAQILDVYTPLSIQDWVGSHQGAIYGIRRSEDQRLGAALLNKTPMKGLFLAGQSVVAPGILGTLLGSLTTVRLIAGQKSLRQLLS